MKRYISIPFIELNVQLHGCVENPTEFCQKLNQWIEQELKPDFDSDIEIEIITSAGWQGNKDDS